MEEKRTRRSDSRDDALQILVETIAQRLGGRGVALVDDRGLLRAGAGRPREMWGLARFVAATSRADSTDPPVEHVAVVDETLRLGAFDLSAEESAAAAKSVARILDRCA